MAFRQTITAVSRALITLLIVLSLGGCEYIEEFFAEESEDIEMEDEDEEEASSLIFGATKNLPWLPWFFAAQEDIFDRYNDEYNLSIQFKPGAYEDIIEQFAEGDIHIIAITNIDAIARFVKREVEVDVILVGSYSNGNDTLLLPSGGD
ncbi:MAG: hypothetical protein GY862_16720, partial [Gammaproteobacteria bacterium]|nr:hypothetical protein [Gammaproteobacteria bacterium]